MLKAEILAGFASRTARRDVLDMYLGCPLVLFRLLLFSIRMGVLGSSRVGPRHWLEALKGLCRTIRFLSQGVHLGINLVGKFCFTPSEDAGKSWA